MKKKRLLILYLLLGICTWGHALNPMNITFRQHPAQTSTQKLSATVQDGENNIEHTRICNREGVIDYSTSK